MNPVASSFEPAPATRVWRCRDRSLTLGGVPQIMGILNVTPDSFFDGGRHTQLELAMARARQLVEEGAAIIDVGGQSTRPGFEEVSTAEELSRVVPVVAAIARELDVVISIDTYRPEVAREALAAGAHIVNDIHGLQDAPALAELAAKHGAGVVAMHHDRTFRDETGRELARMREWFARTLSIAADAGLDPSAVVLDPGIGFYKTQAQNLALLGRLADLRESGHAVLLGASRKSVIAHVLDGVGPEERLEGTLALTALAAWQGVEIVRVHDVRANLRAARVASATRIVAGQGENFS
jgi:dihydropteroate synthase